MTKRICVWVGFAVLALAGNAYAEVIATELVLVAVPEIDAGGAVTALSLLAGVVALAAERLRRK